MAWHLQLDLVLMSRKISFSFDKGLTPQQRELQDWISSHSS
jgi:hypothetical protein